MAAALDGQRWPFSPAELGFVLDAQATAALAHEQGRSPASLAALLVGDAAAEAPPLWRFDPAAASAALAPLAAQVALAPVNAGVAILDGRAVATPAQPGRALDLPATLAALSQDPAGALQRRTVALHVVEVPPEVVDATAAAEAANRLLATTLTIRAFDPINGQEIELPVGPQEWSAWLSLDTSQALAGQFAWKVDQAQLERYLGALSEQLGPERYFQAPEAAAAVAAAINAGATAAEARIYHHDRTHTVEEGETLSSIGRLHGIPYPWIQQANPQAGDQLQAGQTLTIPSPDVLLPLPPVRGKRIVVSIVEQRGLAGQHRHRQQPHRARRLPGPVPRAERLRQQLGPVDALLHGRLPAGAHLGVHERLPRLPHPQRGYPALDRRLGPQGDLRLHPAQLRERRRAV
jgi:hypothetical protein